MTNVNTYSVKASAIRGAKRAGIANAIFTQLESGAWTFSAPAVNPEKPVAIVWNFLANNGEMSRKDQIATLIGMGLNKNMVKTQTSRFYVANGDKKAWYLIDAARKAARIAAEDAEHAKG